MGHEDSDAAAVRLAEQRVVKSLLYYHQVEGMSLEQAWAQVHRGGESEAVDPETARELAARAIERVRLTHPLTMRELLPLYGLDTDALVGGLKEQLGATLPIKVRRDGHTTWTMDDTGGSAPDAKARAAAQERLLKLCGSIPGLSIPPRDLDAGLP